MIGTLGRKKERMAITAGYEWIWTWTSLLLRSVVLIKKEMGGKHDLY